MLHIPQCLFFFVRSLSFDLRWFSCIRTALWNLTLLVSTDLLRLLANHRQVSFIYLTHLICPFRYSLTKVWFPLKTSHPSCYPNVHRVRYHFLVSFPLLQISLNHCNKPKHFHLLGKSFVQGHLSFRLHPKNWCFTKVLQSWDLFQAWSSNYGDILNAFYRFWLDFLVSEYIPSYVERFSSVAFELLLALYLSWSNLYQALYHLCTEIMGK